MSKLKPYKAISTISQNFRIQPACCSNICKLKKKQCEFANSKGYCMVTACIKDGKQK